MTFFFSSCQSRPLAGLDRSLCDPPPAFAPNHVPELTSCQLPHPSAVRRPPVPPAARSAPPFRLRRRTFAVCRCLPPRAGPQGETKSRYETEKSSASAYPALNQTQLATLSSPISIPFPFSLTPKAPCVLFSTGGLHHQNRTHLPTDTTTTTVRAMLPRQYTCAYPHLPIVTRGTLHADRDTPGSLSNHDVTAEKKDTIASFLLACAWLHFNQIAPLSSTCADQFPHPSSSVCRRGLMIHVSYVETEAWRDFWVVASRVLFDKKKWKGSTQKNQILKRTCAEKAYAKKEQRPIYLWTGPRWRQKSSTELAKPLCNIYMFLPPRAVPAPPRSRPIRRRNVSWAVTIHRARRLFLSPQAKPHH